MENIKVHAVKCLVSSSFCTFPIDVMWLNPYQKRWVISSYADSEDIIVRYQLEEYVRLVWALSFRIIENEYLILFNEKLSYSDRNLSIAHEIGHLVLGHTVQGHICGKSQDPVTADRQEQEADAFATYLLAPACVLLAAGITTPCEISHATTVSDKHAETVAAEIARLKDYVPTADEEQLCRCFRRFILANKYRKVIKAAKYTALYVILSAAVTTVLITSLFPLKNNYRHNYPTAGTCFH